MKIALTTIGSRGDIQPYIALGSALRNYGHDVFIATHPWANDLINSWNLKHLPVGDDIDIHYVARQFVENSGNNLKGFHFALNFIFKSLRNCHQDFLEILRDVDLVIGHGIVGSAEADILHKPFVSVSIETMGLQKEYLKYGNLFTKSGVYLGDKLKSFFFGRPYLMFRKEIKAPPPGSVKEFPYLALVPISPLIQKHNPFWKQVTEITGFFFTETPETFIPSENLKKFFNEGEKPILITFGSMFHKQEETHRLFHIICNAINHSNTRALLLMPDLAADNINIPDNLFVISNIPYSWLLQKVSLVIHHYGFGTTAEVLKAGLPSIPVPHIFDQKIRASKIYKMGLCQRPLELGSLNSMKLSDAIVKTLTDTKLLDKCQTTGMRIAQERGLERAVGLIHEYFGK